MPHVIQFEADGCGLGQKLEALADFFELRVWLRADSIATADIADYVLDIDLLDEFERGRYPEQRLERDQEPAQDYALMLAEQVFDRYVERQSALGDSYPFKLADQVLSPRSPADDSLGYLALLAIVGDHSFGARVRTQNQIAELFEHMVSGAVGTQLPLWARMGGNRGDFPTALGELAKALELTANLEGSDVPYPDRANDEGVDVAGHLTWRDERPGRWVVLGQVTVGKEDQWEMKLYSIQRLAWTSWLSTGVTPLRFLAVPQHVANPVLRKLTFGEGDLVLDRLRLCRFLDLSTEVRKFVEDFRKEARLDV